MLGSHSDGNMNTNTHHEQRERERERERESGTRLKSSHPKSHRGGEERKNIESHKYFKSEFVKYLLVVQSKPFQSQSFKMNNVFDEYFAVKSR